MAAQLAGMLESMLAADSPRLRQLTEEQASARPRGPAAWSRKEELGHLIDSAVNNHVRFVRGSLEPEVRTPGYDQDGWVAAHGYDGLSWADLLNCWEQHNLALLSVVKRLNEDRLAVKCVIGDSKTVTLGFLIEDYALHMQHHLDQILGREKVTSYPGAALGV
jgi:hypothetical protein